jgi:RimJ/RimL family protein N-acetyltransferase
MSLLDKTIDIRTARLILRPLHDGDAAAIFALFNDWEVMRFLSSPPWPYALSDAEDYVRAMTNPESGAAETAFAITLHGKLIGSIGVRDRAASHLQEGAGPNIGYWLGRQHWGHGYMTEAVRAMIAHVFALSPADAIYSGAFADNLASLRVQEKTGFALAGNTTLLSRPTGHELAHVNTALTRASFAQLAA